MKRLHLQSRVWKMNLKVQVVQLQLALGPFCSFCFSFYLNSYLQVLIRLTLLVEGSGYLHNLGRELEARLRNIFLIGRCRT